MTLKPSLLLFALCASVTLCAQQAALYIGSDWCSADGALRRVWEDPTFRAEAGIPLSTVDDPNVVTDAVKQTWEKQKDVRWEADRIPAFAYFDAHGRCVLFRQGLPLCSDALSKKLLLDLLRQGKARAERIESLLARGTADSAGEVLSLVIPELGLRRSREAKGMKAAWDLLKRVDPKDASGWDFALTFDPAGEPADKVRAFRDAKDVSGFEAYIRSLESKPQTHLSTNQKQGLALLRYAFWRRESAKASEMKAILKNVLAMDQTTHFGKAAQGLLCLSEDGPVAIPYGWFPKDAPKAGNQTWTIKVGVAKTLTRPGRYALTLARKTGQGTMTVRGLCIGGRTYQASGESLTPGASQEVPFEFREGDVLELLLTVSFDNPKNERGALSLREILSPRVEGEGKRIQKLDNLSALARKSKKAVHAYAQLVLPEEEIEAIAKLPGGSAFLRAFFQDTAWMEDFFGSGDPTNSWGVALRALDELAYRFDLDDPVWKRFATAVALNAEPDPTESVRIFRFMLEQSRRGALWKGFSELRCDQFRLTAIPAHGAAESLEDLASMHNLPPRRYGGTCWTCPYRLHNFFGDSIHGRDYYPPWEHAYVRHQASRLVGGVCGALSYYGAAAARAHGVPSITCGQPAHCAYTLWAPAEKRYVLCYNVNPFSGLHYPLWRDCRNFPYADFSADVFSQPQRKTFLRAFWKAEVARARKTVSLTPGKMTHTVWEWRGRALPTETQSLVKLGEEANVKEISPRWQGRTDWLYHEWKGILDIPHTVEADFMLTSDDGALLMLDGKDVAGKDGLHGNIGRGSRQTLTPGKHPFTLRFFNANGGCVVNLTMKAHDRFNPALVNAYAKVASTCPLNYEAYRAWGQLLADSEGVPAKAYETYAQAVASGLHDHLWVAWKLINPLLPAYEKVAGKPALVTLLSKLHGVLRQSAAPTAEFCNFASILDEHAKLLGKDTDALFALFSAALNAQYGTPNAFGIVMRWGGAQFLAKADTATRMVGAIETLLKTKGSGDSSIGKYISSAILEASKADNMEAFNALCDLQERLNPPRKAYAFPKEIGQLPLLSANAILRTSSTSSWDHPESYRAVLDGFTPTQSFHTGKESAPWAEVRLPGMAMVSAVYILNRDNNRNRILNSDVEVSEDGKTWKKVGAILNVRGDYTFTFEPVKAQRVRVILHPQDGGKNFLHLRKIAVFGKKLY